MRVKEKLYGNGGKKRTLIVFLHLFGAECPKSRGRALLSFPKAPKSSK